MVELGVLFLTALATVGLGLATARLSRRRQLAWQLFAKRHNASYAEPSGVGWFSEFDGSLELDSGPLRIYVDTFYAPSGMSERRAGYTRIRARYALGEGPAFRVYNARIKDVLGETGGIDLVLGGHREFDEQMQVETLELGATRRVWDRVAKSLVTAELGRHVAVASDGVTITLACGGIFDSARELDAAVKLMARLAGTGYQSSAIVKRVPNTNWHDAYGPWDRREPGFASSDVAPGCKLQPAFDNGRFGVRVTVPVTLATEPFELRLWPGGHVEGTSPEGVLGAGAAAQLARVGQGSLTCTGEQVRVFVEEPNHSTERLVAAARLAAAVARPSVAVYR